MKKNMGSADRAIRLLLAVLAVIIGLNEGGPLALVLYIVAAVLLLTAVTAVCPIYRPLHINTNKRG